MPTDGSPVDGLMYLVDVVTAFSWFLCIRPQ